MDRHYCLGSTWPLACKVFLFGSLSKVLPLEDFVFSFAQWDINCTHFIDFLGGLSERMSTKLLAQWLGTQYALNEYELLAIIIPLPHLQGTEGMTSHLLLYFPVSSSVPNTLLSIKILVWVQRSVSISVLRFLTDLEGSWQPFNPCVFNILNYFKNNILFFWLQKK